jgi:hypothetical protein
MGQAPLTGTSCAFPFAGEPDCARTCAEVIGTPYSAIRGVGLAIASLGCILYVFQMNVVVRAYIEDRKNHKYVSQALQRVLEFRFFVGIGLVTFLIQ